MRTWFTAAGDARTTLQQSDTSYQSISWRSTLTHSWYSGKCELISVNVLKTPAQSFIAKYKGLMHCDKCNLKIGYTMVGLEAILEDPQLYRSEQVLCPEAGC